MYIFRVPFYSLIKLFLLVALYHPKTKVKDAIQTRNMCNLDHLFLSKRFFFQGGGRAVDNRSIALNFRQ